MKVLFVSTVPFVKNGLVHVIMNLYRILTKEGIKVDIVAATGAVEDIYVKEILDSGGKFIPVSRSAKHPLLYIYNIAKISRNYDIIHVHGNSGTMALEMIGAKIANVPLRITHTHSSSCKYKIANTTLKPFMLLFSNGRIACGKQAGKFLYGKKPFIIVKNGVNTEKFRFDINKRNDIRKMLGWDNCLVIGHVGNFVEVKNHSFLLDVFFKVAETNKNARLILLGDGKKLDEIKTKAKNLKVSDKVYFAGSVFNVDSYLSAMDVIVMPSFYEGVPLTLIEEQANGLQGIVSDTISKEVDVTGKVKFLSLSHESSFWANEISSISIINDRTLDSNSNINKIKNAGFDIQFQALKLKQYYKQKGKK